jgi:hypothetical protein
MQISHLLFSSRAYFLQIHGFGQSNKVAQHQIKLWTKFMKWNLVEFVQASMHHDNGFKVIKSTLVASSVILTTLL